MKVKLGKTCVCIPKGVHTLEMDKSYAARLFKQEMAKETGTFLFIRKGSTWYGVQAVPRGAECDPRKMRKKLMSIMRKAKVPC